MIRSIFTVMYFALFLIITLPYYLVLLIVKAVSPEAFDKASLATIKWAFKTGMVVSGTKVTYIGTENIPEDRAVLFVGNHRSIFDAPVTYSQMKAPSGFISKKETNSIPLLNLWMKNIGCFFMDRDDIKQSMQIILSSIERIKQGKNIIIFPEGTRSKVEGEFLPFKAGSFKIAEKSKCDIIPVSICDTGRIFEDHKPFVKKTHVICEFCAPVSTSDLSREEMKQLPDKVRNTIIEAYNRNKENV